DNSIRGYDYESLGPANAAGELTGGNRLLEASVEYEHPLLAQWAVAAFIDSGNAFRGSDFEARTGVGIGARWFSPLGPVRFDVAWPRDAADRQRELHISLGPDLWARDEERRAHAACLGRCSDRGGRGGRQRRGRG